MKENTNSMLWVLLLTVFGGVIAFIIFSHQYSTASREGKEIDTRYDAISAALHMVYQKLTVDKNTTTNKELIVIHPDDVRNAFAKGVDGLGELPDWVSADQVYLPRRDVPLWSGKFICLVYFGKRSVPFGLTSKGECRYGKVGEVVKEEFIPFRP